MSKIKKASPFHSWQFTPLHTLKVMAQLTIFNPNGSIADIFLISNTLAVRLTKFLQYSRRKFLNLALLREIKMKVLFTVFKVLTEKSIKINNIQEVEAFAICTVDWFISLLDVIYRIERLPNSNSLTIRLSN